MTRIIKQAWKALIALMIITALSAIAANHYDRQRAVLIANDPEGLTPDLCAALANDFQPKPLVTFCDNHTTLSEYREYCFTAAAGTGVLAGIVGGMYVIVGAWLLFLYALGQVVAIIKNG